MKCQEPLITTGKGVGLAECSCGWSSPLVWDGAAGATYAWAVHIAQHPTTQEHAA